MIRADAAGATTSPRLFSWDERDTILYALGVGAGQADLALVTENSHDVQQQVLPTFGVIVADPSTALALVGEVDVGMLVHGSQTVRLLEPLEAAGSLVCTSSVTGIWDKGSGGSAILTLEARAADPHTHAVKVHTTSTVILRGGGGFGGEPGPSVPRGEAPPRTPDAVVEHATSPDQALIYRLSGDRNPLHSDPWFAQRRAGFPRPILHGLCTYGFAGRALLTAACDDDPSRFLEMSARFTAPVLPGDVLRTEIWHAGEGRVSFRTWAQGDASPARLALDVGSATYLTG